MARRCLCDRLLTLLDDDARLRTLPLAARMLWLTLARYAARMDNLRIPFAGTARVSLLVSATETETETQLETLLRDGLVLREGDTLAIPLLEAGAERTGAARANGRLGGRPRKGETAEEAALRRRQGNLPLPIEGGAGKAVAETQRNPTAETPLTRAKKESNSTSHSSFPSSPAAQAHEVDALARELATTFGLRFSQAPVVAEWMKAGATAAVIRQVAAAVAANPNRPAITSIRYLTRDVVEQAEACAPQPEGNPSAAAYIAEVQQWQANGCLGPAPVRHHAA